MSNSYIIVEVRNPKDVAPIRRAIHALNLDEADAVCHNRRTGKRAAANPVNYKLAQQLYDRIRQTWLQYP